MGWTTLRTRVVSIPPKHLQDLVHLTEHPDRLNRLIRVKQSVVEPIPSHSQQLGCRIPRVAPLGDSAFCCYAVSCDDNRNSPASRTSDIRRASSGIRWYRAGDFNLVFGASCGISDQLRRSIDIVTYVGPSGDSLLFFSLLVVFVPGDWSRD